MRIPIVLDAPGNYPDKQTDKYTVQVVVSWPIRSGVLERSSPVPVPDTNDEKLRLLKTLAESWSEPFKSLVCNAPAGTEVKCLNLTGWAPPKGLRSTGRVALVGDALHPMAMCEFNLSLYVRYLLHFYALDRHLSNLPWVSCPNTSHHACQFLILKATPSLSRPRIS